MNKIILGILVSFMLITSAMAQSNLVLPLNTPTPPPPPSTLKQEDISGTVDIQLVLAIDRSSSISEKEFAWHINGYAAAFRDSRLIQTIKSGNIGRIAVAVTYWGNPGQEIIAIPWTEITAENSTEFSTLLESLAIEKRFPWTTGIGGGLFHAFSLFAELNVDPIRKIILISGDGPNNTGFSPHTLSDDISLNHKITINGIAILDGSAGRTENYYRENVIAGIGNFVVSGKGEEDFTNALIRLFQFEGVLE